MNYRLGMSSKDDSIPYKVHACPIQTGPTAGRVIDKDEFDRLLKLYYKRRGWDDEGMPPREMERRFTDLGTTA